MSTSKEERMQLFLDQNYVTLANLALRCKVSENEILNLETAQCIPRHTYEVRTLVMFTCAGINDPLTENIAATTIFYYHLSTINWVEQALLAAKNMSLSEVAFQVKNDFANGLNKVLDGVKTPGCQSFDQAWGYFIDGTWGKCLKEISLECLAKKELSRLQIAEIMQQDAAKINLDTKIKLTNAINEYITASLDFDAYGTRYILAEEAINKFQLDINIDKKYLVG